MFKVTSKANRKGSILRVTTKKALGGAVNAYLGFNDKKEISISIPDHLPASAVTDLEKSLSILRKQIGRLMSYAVPGDSGLKVYNFALISLREMVFEFERVDISGIRENLTKLADKLISEFMDGISQNCDEEFCTGENLTLFRLMKEYMEFRKGEVSKRTVASDSSSMAKIVDVSKGARVKLTELNKLYVKKVIEGLEKYPINRNINYPDLALDSIFKIEDYQKIDRQTFSFTVSFLRRTLSWGYHEGYMEHDLTSTCDINRSYKARVTKNTKGQLTLPTNMTGAVAGSAKSAAKDRVWPTDMLERIFNTHFYTGTERSRYVAKHGYTPLHFWLFVICLYTGMRSREVAQLMIDDVIEIDGCWGFVVNDDDEEGVKRVKTANSRRFVPIHSDLIRIGILDYLAWRRAQKGVPDVLRPFLMTPINKSFIDRGLGRHVIISRTIRREAKAVVKQKYTAHSFRHLFIRELREAGYQDREIAQVVGHDSALSGDGRGEELTTTKYGNRALTIRELAMIVDAFKPPISTDHISWENYKRHLLMDWWDYKVGRL